MSFQESMFFEQLLNAVVLEAAAFFTSLYIVIWWYFYFPLNWYVLACQFIWKFQILWKYESKNHCVWNSDPLLFGGLFELINMTKKH